MNRILVAVDLSEASRAVLGYAAALAQRLGASLTALYVSPRHASYEPFPTFPPAAPLDPAQARALEQDVRRFVADAGGPPGAEIAVREGDPADEIVAEAARATSDLVVVGTHGRRGFERWSLGSVTDRLVRRADRPTLAVPAHAALPPSPRVLCALDLSDASGGILEYGARLTQALAGRLTVLHVAEGRHWYDPWSISGVDEEAVRKAVEEAARKLVSDLVARHVPEGPAPEVSVTFGRADREIERVAASAADLVVLGVTARSGIDRFFFGSTAQHVLRAGACPVLLLRQAGTAVQEAEAVPDASPA